MVLLHPNHVVRNKTYHIPALPTAHHFRLQSCQALSSPGVSYTNGKSLCLPLILFLAQLEASSCMGVSYFCFIPPQLDEFGAQHLGELRFRLAREWRLQESITKTGTPLTHRYDQGHLLSHKAPAMPHLSGQTTP